MTISTPTRPQGIALWWQAIRPKTLGMAINPVLIGATLAWIGAGRFVALDVPLVILLCAIAIQAGTNLFNDLRDGVQGDDSDDRLGPPRITALGWAKPHHVSIAGLLSFLLAFLGGLYLITLGGWVIFYGGLASVLAGYLYSYGPYPISRTPFGEIVVIAFFGLFAVIGTVYLMTGRFGVDALVWGLVMGLPAGAVLLLNNVRDVKADTRAGRKTLAIVVGVGAARWLYGAMMVLPYAIVAYCAITDMIPLGGIAMFATAPLAIKTIRRFSITPPSVRLNPLLGATVRLQGLIGISAIIGMGITQLA